MAHAGKAAVAQAALAPEPRSPLQGTQVPAALQIGLAPEHCAFETHSTHVLVTGSQALVGATQLPLLVGEHGAQLPAFGPLVRHAGRSAVRHAWVAPLPKSPLQGTHVPPSQLGFEAGHWPSVTHSTQVFVVVLHCGLAPPQSLKSRHSTHVAAVTLQRGVGDVQFASEAQPGPQVFVERLQRPLAPAHSPFERHWTQSWVASLQTGSPGVHAVTLVPNAPSLHSKHEPETQAGRSAPGHARTPGGAPAVPLSALQPSHAFVAVLQTGRGPVSTQLPLVTHSTQTFVAVLQTGVAPVQRTPFPALHWTQAPVVTLHAGSAGLGQALGLALPLSPSQGTQAPAAEHTGFVGLGH